MKAESSFHPCFPPLASNDLFGGPRYDQLESAKAAQKLKSAGTSRRLTKCLSVASLLARNRLLIDVTFPFGHPPLEFKNQLRMHWPFPRQLPHRQ
jgi:hypothetical protein